MIPIPPVVGSIVENSQVRFVVKCGFIVLLILFLQIPLLVVNSLRYERESRRREAVQELCALWGGEQTITGPILVIPFSYQVESTQETLVAGKLTSEKIVKSYRSQAYFLPDQLEVSGQLDTEKRQRGIYSAVVYRGKLRLKGSFARPDWAALGQKASEIHWSEARVLLGISDPRGIREASALDWQGRKLEWSPGTRWSEMKNGLHSAITGMNAETGAQAFSLEINLNGSSQFSCVPLGRTSSVELASPCPDPSFNGACLPASRTVGPAGFSARWSLSYLGSNLPHQWTERPGETAPGERELRAAGVGVGLLSAVDAYRSTERAIKHGIVFLLLVFTVFFIFEMKGVPGLSILHYALVGAALCLFFLGLLALSEFIGFGAAYLASALASTILVSLYSIAVLRCGQRALVVAAGLSLVYGYLYFVLQMQDYALLAGTAALFAALGSVMWCTRRFAR